MKTINVKRVVNEGKEEDVVLNIDNVYFFYDNENATYIRCGDEILSCKENSEEIFNKIASKWVGMLLELHMGGSPIYFNTDKIKYFNRGANGASLVHIGDMAVGVDEELCAVQDEINH